MKLFQPIVVLLAVCLTVSDSVHAVPHAICGDGATPGPTSTPSMTPEPTTTSPAPTTPSPTTPAPTTPAPTTPAPPRIPSVKVTDRINGKSLTLPPMTPRVCYNVDKCSARGFDEIIFYNFDVYGGALFLPFSQANCKRQSWYGFMSSFLNTNGQPDIRRAAGATTFKSFVLQSPGDTGFGPSYDVTKSVCSAPLL